MQQQDAANRVSHLKTFRRLIFLIAIFFLFPMGASLAWWSTVDRPANWRQADWHATGTLPSAGENDEAAIYVMAARTGGLKGAFAVHTWIVTKAEGADSYNRYDKVGWGTPVRQNAYAADAAWYSNRPFIVKAITGDAAAALIGEVERAVASYEFGQRGDYSIWPGPNSNTFAAHVVNTVPQLNAVLPPNAVGKDFIGNGRFFRMAQDGRDFQVSAWGLIGFSIGLRSGIELHFLGETLGLDIVRPAIKLPGIGRVGMALS